MRNKYEIEEALRTLMRAEEIKSDKKLMKDVFSLAKEQKDSIASIEDLKKAYERAVEKEDEEDEDEEGSESSSSIKRYEKAKEEAEEPEIPMVKVVED